MKEETTKINITLPTELVEKIKDNNYNRNQLLVSLLKKHIKNKQK
jgi:post-segregation antitoxin (ccd killing protein)